MYIVCLFNWGLRILAYFVHSFVQCKTHVILEMSGQRLFSQPTLATDSMATVLGQVIVDVLCISFIWGSGWIVLVHSIVPSKTHQVF